MSIENLIEDAVESINSLNKFVKTHQTSTVNYDVLDELEQSIGDLQEIAYELEARVTDDQEGEQMSLDL